MLNEKGETSSFIANGEWALLGEFLLQLVTKIREYFTITEKAPTSAFSWLKGPNTLAFSHSRIC